MLDVFIQGSKPSFDENCEKIEHYILHVFVLYACSCLIELNTGLEYKDNVCKSEF